jgi:hypothetical protein
MRQSLPAPCSTNCSTSAERYTAAWNLVPFVAADGLPRRVGQLERSVPLRPEIGSLHRDSVQLGRLVQVRFERQY